jgi:transglutaminase-like putative cysteine protease
LSYYNFLEPLVFHLDVSGYICPNESGLGVRGNACLGRNLFPKQGWLGIDPTNNIWTMENHVKLSVGLNFSECTPIKGTFKGFATQTLSVSVSIGMKTEAILKR